MHENSDKKLKMNYGNWVGTKGDMKLLQFKPSGQLLVRYKGGL